ncbi:MAG: hypothetical protein JWP63_7037, partial [Candidatus Solibacter sp.]|nr:hypothetical protein [Candidatus Solibacter sp.]
TVTNEWKAVHGPSALVFGPDGNLYVADEVTVVKFNGTTGAFMSVFVRWASRTNATNCTRVPSPSPLPISFNTARSSLAALRFCPGLGRAKVRHGVSRQLGSFPSGRPLDRAAADSNIAAASIYFVCSISAEGDT